MRARLAPLIDLMHAGLFPELETRSRQLLSQWPECGEAWQLLGWALTQQGKDPLPALMESVRYLPDDAAALVNLGSALGRAGRLGEAEARYVRALELRPGFAEALGNLATVQLEQGKLTEAQASLRRVIVLQRADAGTYNSLGVVLLKLARPQEAVDNFERAIGLDPGFAQAHANLANALRSQGRLDESIDHYGRAVRIDPDFVAAHLELATALRLQRRRAESEAACRQALRIDPLSAGAYGVLAELQADNGNFADAEALLRRAVAVDPNAVEAWVGLTRVRRMSPADAGWLEAAEALVRTGLSPQREMILRYAMGKYLDDVREFSRAFASYERANELAKNQGPPHDRAQLSRAIDWIIRTHDRDWVSRTREESSASRRPVFVIGMLRSGTTLAEQILASHPAVFGAGELTFWSHPIAELVSGGPQARDPVDPAMQDARLASLAQGYLDLLDRGSPEAARVVDKFPTNFMAAGLIHAALPNARFIHMRRDPLDTCLSIYFQHFEAANTYANDLADLGHYYLEYERLMNHWRAVLPADSMLEVPYEELTGNPDEWTRAMLDFIGLPWDPACLHFQRPGRAVVTASKWQVRQPIGTSSVGRWRNYERFLGPLRQSINR